MSATWQQGGYSGPQAPPPLAHQAPPPAPAWRAPTHPGPRTNLLAVLAIVAAVAGATVLLGLGSLAAIVLGGIALAQVRRTGEDGRLLAVWSIVLGAVTLVALVAMAVIGIGMVVAMVEQLAPTLAP